MRRIRTPCVYAVLVEVMERAFESYVSEHVMRKVHRCFTFDEIK